MELDHPFHHTVDGSDIQRSPVEVGSLSTIIHKVLYIWSNYNISPT